MGGYKKSTYLCSQKTYEQKGIVMSTATLTSLLDYLYGALTPNNMRWVGEHLIEYAKKEEANSLKPLTMKEIDDMLDEAETAFEAGDYMTNDEVFHHHKESVAV